MSEEVVLTPEVPPSNTPKKALGGGGLNSAFLLIYKICAIIAVVAFVIMTLVAIASPI